MKKKARKAALINTFIHLAESAYYKSGAYDIRALQESDSSKEGIDEHDRRDKHADKRD